MPALEFPIVTKPRIIAVISTGNEFHPTEALLSIFSAVRMKPKKQFIKKLNDVPGSNSDVTKRYPQLGLGVAKHRQRHNHQCVVPCGAIWCSWLFCNILCFLRRLSFAEGFCFPDATGESALKYGAL